jgi:hypothetical protein
MMEMKTAMAQTLQDAGWQLKTEERTFELPTSLQERYPHLPESLVAFLSGLRQCHNADDTAWFLCQADYEGASGLPFRWNEFELMELESAEQDGDTDWQAGVKAFWDKHFPFLLSVKTGYSYFAVSVEQSNFGAVIHGFEPEFLESSEVAPSFDEFLVSLVQAGQDLEADGLIRAAI